MSAPDPSLGGQLTRLREASVWDDADSDARPAPQDIDWDLHRQIEAEASREQARRARFLIENAAASDPMALGAAYDSDQGRAGNIFPDILVKMNGGEFKPGDGVLRTQAQDTFGDELDLLAPWLMQKPGLYPDLVRGIEPDLVRATEAIRPERIGSVTGILEIGQLGFEQGQDIVASAPLVLKALSAALNGDGITLDAGERAVMAARAQRMADRRRLLPGNLSLAQETAQLTGEQIPIWGTMASAGVQGALVGATVFGVGAAGLTLLTVGGAPAAPAVGAAAAPVGAEVVGGILALKAGVDLETAEIYGSILSEHPELEGDTVVAWIAATGGLVAGSLEFIPANAVLASFKAFIKAGVTQGVKRFTVGRASATLGVELAKGRALEAGTEGAQQAVGAGARAIALGYSAALETQLLQAGDDYDIERVVGAALSVSTAEFFSDRTLREITAAARAGALLPFSSFTPTLSFGRNLTLGIQSQRAEKRVRALAFQTERLRQRSVRATEDFVSREAQGSDIETIYLDATQINALYSERDEDAGKVFEDLGLGAEYQEAAAASADVRVPLGTFIAEFAGRPEFDQVFELMKTDPAGMTPPARRLWQAQQRAENAQDRSRIAEQESVHEAISGAANQITARLETQLDRATEGRFKAGDARSTAAIAAHLLTVSALRAKLDPVQLLNRWSIETVGSLQGMAVRRAQLAERLRGEGPLPSEFLDSLADEGVATAAVQVSTEVLDPDSDAARAAEDPTRGFRLPDGAFVSREDSSTSLLADTSDLESPEAPVEALLESEGAAAVIDFNATERFATIGMSPDATPVDFLHEMMHFHEMVLGPIVEGLRGQENLSFTQQKLIADWDTLQEYARERDALYARVEKRIMSTRPDLRGAELDSVVQREKLAAAFEVYLRDSDPPSESLRGPFRDLKTWFSSVFQRLTNQGMTINAPITRVFDRMLASDMAINQARAADLFNEEVIAGPLFEDMTESERADFNTLLVDAEERAKESLVREFYAQAERERTKLFPVERRRVKQEVEEELRADPHVQMREWIAGAGKWIGPSEMPEALAGLRHARLDPTALRQAMGDEAFERVPATVLSAANARKEPWHPQELLETLRLIVQMDITEQGFFEALQGPSFAKRVAEQTDLRIAERTSDTTTQAWLDERARELLNEVEQQRLLEARIALLTRLTRGGSDHPSALRRALAARAAVSQAPMEVRGGTPEGRSQAVADAEAALSQTQVQLRAWAPADGGDARTRLRNAVEDALSAWEAAVTLRNQAVDARRADVAVARETQVTRSESAILRQRAADRVADIPYEQLVPKKDGRKSKSADGPFGVVEQYRRNAVRWAARAKEAIARGDLGDALLSSQKQLAESFAETAARDAVTAIEAVRTEGEAADTNQSLRADLGRADARLRDDHDREATRLGEANPLNETAPPIRNFTQQLEAVLAKLGVLGDPENPDTTAPGRWDAWVRAQEDAGHVADFASLAGIPTGFEKMTVTEARQISKMLRIVTAQGRGELRSQLRADQQDFEGLRNGLVSRIRTTWQGRGGTERVPIVDLVSRTTEEGGTEVTEVVVGHENRAKGRAVRVKPVSGVGQTTGDRVHNLLTKLHGQLVRFEFAFQGADDAAAGQVWESMFVPTQRAESNERERLREFTQSANTIFRDHFGSLLEGPMGFSEKARRNPMAFRWNSIHVPALASKPGKREWLSPEQVIAVALNFGNTGNKNHLQNEQVGGFSQAEVSAILEAGEQFFGRRRDGQFTLWSFAQQTWDLYQESFWADIVALETRLNGVAPEQVKGEPFRRGETEYRGGYYPIVLDPEGSLGNKLERAVRELVVGNRVDASRGGSAAQPMTAQNHLAARDANANSPLLLNLSPIMTTARQVIHDLTHRETVIDLSRMIADSDFRSEWRSLYGSNHLGFLDQWIERVARGVRKPGDGAEKYLSSVRNGVRVSILGYKATVFLIQYAGLGPSHQRLRMKGTQNGTRHLSAGFLSWTRGLPGQDAKDTRVGYSEFILARSPFMAGRSETYDADAFDTMQNLGVFGSMKGQTANAAFKFISIADMHVSRITWMAAYRQAMAGDVANIEPTSDIADYEPAAIAYADGVVRQSQGSGAIKDIAAIQDKEGTLPRDLTMFMTFFSAYYNMEAEQGRALRNDPRSLRNWSNAIEFVVVTMMLPLMYEATILARGPKEDEEWVAWMAREGFMNQFNTIPLARNLAYAAKSGHPADLLNVDDPFAAAVRTVLDPVPRSKKDFADLLSSLDLTPLGPMIGTNQIKQTASAAHDLMFGIRDVDLRELLIRIPEDQRGKLSVGGVFDINLPGIVMEAPP